MKSAEVYLREGVAFIGSMSCTTAGVWLANRPTVLLPADSGPERIGAATLTALELSEEEIPHPTDFDAIARPLLEAAHVLSWRQFQRGTCCCAVDKDEAGYLLTPHRSIGNNGGFQPIAEKASSLVPTASPLVLGLGIMNAFENCEL